MIDRRNLLDCRCSRGRHNCDGGYKTQVGNHWGYGKGRHDPNFDHSILMADTDLSYLVLTALGNSRPYGNCVLGPFDGRGK